MARVLAVLMGLFLCAIGPVFILYPATAAAAFGVDPSHMADLPLTPAVGIREIALGLTIVALALVEPRAAGIALVIATVVPLVDGYLAFKAFGWSTAWRHLAPAPVSLILGLALVKR